MFTLHVLFKVRDRAYPEETARLRAAAERFELAVQHARGLSTVEKPKWSLPMALGWRGHLDSTRQFCLDCCLSWPEHLLKLPADQRDCAAHCVEEIEKRISLLGSSRLADFVAQLKAIDTCMILNGQLISYVGDTDFNPKFAAAIVHDQKKWAALFEALFENRWLDSNNPRQYLNTVATTIYRRDVRPDVSGRDSQGFEHRAGSGGRIKQSDALSSEYLLLDELAEEPSEVLFERRVTEMSISALQAAAADDLRLKEYIDAIVRNPKWKRPAIWASLRWNEAEGKAVDRRYRRLRKRLRDMGAGMEWREVPTPCASASQFVYFELLQDGARGKRFGVYQHKSLEIEEK